MWVSERRGMPGGEWSKESDLVLYFSLEPYAVAPGQLQIILIYSEISWDDGLVGHGTMAIGAVGGVPHR